MKASNLSTPRSLAECQFFPAADPIERPTARGRISATAVWLAVICLTCFAVAVVASAAARA